MKTKACICIVITLVMASILGGCGSPSESQYSEPVNIAFVVGIADDETKFNDAITELSELPALPGSNYAFISAEGTPATIGDPGTIPDFSDRGYTRTMMNRVYAGIKADLTERLASYQPSTAEIDMAASTELAVRTLEANATEGRSNVLVYYCGGKSTTGLINMTETPVYKLDVDASLKELSESMNADMSDIDIVWYCCGDFGDKQEKLSPTEKAKLKEFYEQLFYSLGAKSVTFKQDLPSEICYAFPDTPVSCMEVEGTTSQLKELVVLNPEAFKGTDVLKEPIVIPESKIQYQPDSAEFLDPAAATDTIRPVAKYLEENPDVNILLYGTCAGDSDNDYSLWLGKARAESVKTLLIEAGVDDDRITAVTVKVADDPYHQYGLGTGAEGSVNRKTVMVDASTELAAHIMAYAQ